MFTFAQNRLEGLAVNVRWSRTLERILGQVWRQAIREWLRYFVLRVPVETGMARGAFQPLGRFLREAIPITPIRKPYFSKLEGGIQDPGFGAQKTEFLIKDDKTNPGQLIFEFEWITQVLHYYLSEFYNGPATPGEDLIEEAASAFEDYLYHTVTRRVSNELSPTYVPLILQTRKLETGRG